MCFIKKLRRKAFSPLYFVMSKIRRKHVAKIFLGRRNRENRLGPLSNEILLK